jgi:multisubunit Na+/H+ antiporter MnhG subunit
MASSILQTLGVFLIVVGVITAIWDWAIRHGKAEVPDMRWLFGR